MRILAGIFYLLAFIGIMTAAHFVPATTPVPAKTISKAPSESKSEEVPIEIPEPPPVPLEEKIDAALSLKSQETNAELKKLRATLSENTDELDNLYRKFDQIADSNASLKNENSLLAKRLAKVELRPVFVDPKTETNSASESEESTSEPEKVTPPPRPIPKGKSVTFTLGSMDFSESALETLRKAADEMALNDNVVISLRGSTSGFGTSLGTGRAEAVKSKLAEFGVASERVSVSEQSGTSGDSVQLSFKKK